MGTYPAFSSETPSRPAIPMTSKERQSPQREARVLTDRKPGSFCRKLIVQPKRPDIAVPGSLLCTVGIMIPALPVSLNHCEDGISPRQAEKAQPTDKNELIPHCLSR